MNSLPVPENSGRMNDATLKKTLMPWLREYLYREGAPGIASMNDDQVLWRLRQTFVSMPSSARHERH